VSLLDMFREKETIKQTIEIPILCRFSQEDGVWNGSAEHLPVSVFGDTFEEAQHNLVDAILAHLESVQEQGDIKKTIEHLRSCAKEHCLSIEDMASDQPLMRFNAALQDHRISALV
jgi:predicted RNase H-like HicB family nuclease